MRRLSQLWRLLWGCGCLACHLINAALICLAVGQAGLITLNLLQKEVPLPDQFTRWVLHKVGPDDLHFDWSTIFFDLRSGILLENLSISQRSTEQIIATAESARLQWSPIHLLFPHFLPFSEVQARGVHLYLPVSLSPSGLNEPAVQIEQLDLRQDEGALLIRHLDLKAGNVNLHLSGSAPLPLQLSLPQSAQPPAQADSIPPYFKALQTFRRIDPDLHLQTDVFWTLQPGHTHLLHFQAFLPELNVSDWRLSALELKSSVEWRDGRLKVTEVSARGKGRYLGELPAWRVVREEARDRSMPFQISGQGPSQDWGSLEGPGRFDLWLDTGRHLERVERIRARLEKTAESIPLQVHAHGPDLRFNAHTELTIKDLWPIPSLQELIPHQVALELECQHLAGEEFYGDSPPDRLLEGASIGRISLSGQLFLQNIHNPHFQGFANLDDLFIGQTAFHYVASPLHLDRYQLAMPAIEATKNTRESASGAYFHHFPSTRFSLIAEGAIFPESLNNLLGRWWRRIFRDIEASQPIPADVTVWGFWRDELSLRSVTGVSGRGARYQGAEIPELDLLVRSNEAWAWLERLEGRFGEGERLRGEVALRSNLGEEDAYRAIVVDLTSTAPWEVVQRASGVEALEILEIRGSAPEVWARGVIWEDSGKGYDKATEAALQFGLRQPSGRSQVESLELKGLNVGGRVSGQELLLEPVTGEFAEGIFGGSIRVENWQERKTQSRSYDLELYDAQYGPAIEQLGALISNPEDVTDPLVQGARQGRLDAEIVLQIRPESSENSGRGSVNLRQSNVGQIHLFGGLSRFLDTLGLGFSTLDLNTLSLDWELSGDTLAIERGLVSGPVLNLQLSGTVDVKERELSLQADLNLFRGVVSKVLTPMSGNMQFDLVGPLESPEWRIRFTPFRWLGGRGG